MCMIMEKRNIEKTVNKKIAKIGGFYDFDEENIEHMKKFEESIDKQ